MTSLDIQNEELIERLSVMLVIFCVSLFAVSFPTLTATFRSIRVPSIVFFIGKHFGTGVILSTAFVHLLQDAFKGLLNPEVNKRWKVGHWAGLIVLMSLLSIFFIEYISTAFVDRLHSYPSAPSTPTASAVSSSASSVRSDCIPPTRPTLLVESPEGTRSIIAQGELTGTNHLPGAYCDSFPSCATPLNLGHASYGATVSPHDPPSVHPLPSRPPARLANSLTCASAPPGDAFFSGGHHRHEPRDAHETHYCVSRTRWWHSLPWSRTPSPAPNDGGVECGRPSTSSSERSNKTNPKDGAKRKSGHHHGHGHGHGRGSHDSHHGHAHMDMERWMDGMDEADDAQGVSHSRGHSHTHDGEADEECRPKHGHGAEEVTKIGRRRQVIGILVLQLGIMIHSLVIGLTLSIATGTEFTTLVVAIVFHQLFEGLSLGIRIAGLPATKSKSGHSLKPVLAITFATTTPLGIGLGLATLGGAQTKGPNLILLQGVMSAVSAGMLIYAACVEMLAGDFVMDAHLWRSSIRRQALALASVFLGVCAMTAIGM
ncbi:Zinc/iron permease [Epithele typhae]|uniref:Zinc/iron permease n=1 Tax=Epithele typhae TaxID=378194 RepID=UPI002007F5FE|nr:Zinc/iron permease [Epithele typhae]KAH9939796.1 Zinc/iron permease [Epithele typhae]